MCSHMEHHVLKILTNSSRRLPTVRAKIEPGDANILARTKNLWLRMWDVSECEMNSVIEISVRAPTPSEKRGSPEVWTACPRQLRHRLRKCQFEVNLPRPV